MKKAKIFIVGDKQEELTPMVETPYPSEDILQVLLSSYPDLLPGDQINPEAPLKWLLVKREIGVPGMEAGNDHWSLDHLFLDQHGIPTYVECKRATDTRARREVVAQMLDYAANGTAYWTIDRLRQDAAETAKSQNKSLDDEIRRLLQGNDDVDQDIDIETYWEAVERNLRDGKVRLLFVADETHRELRRLVEFLNEKMIDVEVLAVEIKQFIGQGEKKALVPRLIGLTEAIRKAKDTARGNKRKINREQFLENCDAVAAEIFTHIIDSAGSRGKTINWGTKGFSVRTTFSDNQDLTSFAYGWPWGQFDFYFGDLPLTREEEMSLRKKLLSLETFEEAGEKTLKTFIKAENLDRLKEVFSIILDEIDEIEKTH